jgi:hypothetical protein
MDLRSQLFAAFGRESVKNGYGCFCVNHGRQSFGVAIDNQKQIQVEGRWAGWDTPEKTFSLHGSVESAIAQIRTEMVDLVNQDQYIYQEFPPETDTVPEAVSALFETVA